MTFPGSLVLWFISLVRFTVTLNVINTNETLSRDFLRNLNEKSAEIASKLASAQWECETNNTENAQNELIQITSNAIRNAKLRFQNVINNYPWKSFSNPDVRRQLKLFSEIGILALPDEDYHQFQKIISDLDLIHQNTTICDYYNKTKCDLHLHPDIQEKLESSQNSGELSYLWSEWRKATEQEFTKLLNSYVKLCNQAAALNNYGNFQEYSLRNIESEDIKKEMIKMWEDIKPLYSHIHAYVRRKLRNIYGEKVVPLKGPIPAHLLGNIWSENWLGVAQRVIPFPEQDNLNFTASMISQGYTRETIRKQAEDFLTSMNFSVPPYVWLNASEIPVTKNSDSCHPKIFNFYTDGVRIKDCEKISLKEYLEDIRLLTKAEYILQYGAQPFVYQAPADPGLEEAMNNIMTMSASTFDNLKKLGLFKGEVTEEIRLNSLFKLALEKITSISFLLVQEFWRWDIYSGKTVEETVMTVNDLREKFQGISTFTKELTFDPGGIGSAFSKLSLAHHFLGYFLEFQIYESLCQMSKPFQQEYDINECNLSHNAEAGKALRELMRLGSSKILSESFSSVLGSNKIDSKSILKYFEPLMRWLTKENANEGEFIGWEESEQSKEKDKPLKTRRKRSLEDYQTEMKDDGDPNSDFKSNIASKEGSYENMVDYNRLKPSDIRDDIGEDKGTNKLWSVKSYLTDSAKIMQSSPLLDEKDSLLDSHFTSSVMSHPQDEKSVGKKEATEGTDPSLAAGKESVSESRTSSESELRHVNFEMPSLQSLLQKADLNSFGQNQILTVIPEVSEAKTRNDMNQMNGGKNNYNKYGNNPYLYKYAPTPEMLQYKDKKEFRDADAENGNKSPYIIVLGQMTPDMRDKLQDKGVNFMELDRQALMQNRAMSEEMSNKRSRASEQIYIVPIDLNNSQHNLMKTNRFAEHDHEAGHDANTERDQKPEEEQVHLGDNSKLEDKSNFYKTGKESPSEFIISWNNDKNRKIVKRRKREHKKEIIDDKLKVVRIDPSFLEGLLGNSLNHATLGNKNTKILIHDALLNGNSDLSSALASASSPGGTMAVASPVIDQSQIASLQPSSSLSTLASSVLSALSPKGFSQVAKAATQHQDSDLEEENLKESGNVQPLGEKKGAKLHSDDDTKTLVDVDPAAKGDDACCKKIILTPCPPRCPCSSPCPLPCPLPCPCPCPCPPPCPCPCPDDCCKKIIECPALCCKPECPDMCCKKPSECSFVNCQFKITKAKKPHERLTIMIYDRINPPAELPEPYDALAVISEILQRIQCCSCKPSCQLTEEDPDYPANDNTDQLKGNPGQDSKARIQELSGEIPILGSGSPEEDESDDNPQIQSFPSSGDEDKYQPKEKATPALDQLTVFNKDKLKPVFIELRKIDDIIKKRSQKE